MTLRFGRPGDEFAREEGGGTELRGKKNSLLGFRRDDGFSSLVRGEACRPAARRGFNTGGGVVGFSEEVMRGPRHGEAIRWCSSATAWRPRDDVTGIGESWEERDPTGDRVSHARAADGQFSYLFCAPNPFFILN